MEPGSLDQPTVRVPTADGILRTRIVRVNEELFLVATSEAVPAVPIVRFHSSCVFGEAFHATDCDCGAQLDAARRLILAQGGILIYAWEEGRGVGIVDKIRAISLQQRLGMSTTQAFSQLGYTPDPRSFLGHIGALRAVFDGKRIRLASSNPQKISALETAGYVVERVNLTVEMTPEREVYRAHKREYLGHLSDD